MWRWQITSIQSKGLERGFGAKVVGKSRFRSVAFVGGYVTIVLTLSNKGTNPYSLTCDEIQDSDVWWIANNSGFLSKMWRLAI